jgi:hypothetical protein
MGALAGGGVATVLSLMVLSRIFGDNPLYRLAQYLLVGVALGYTAAVLVGQTLVPALLGAAEGTASLTTLIVLGAGLALGLLLMTRFGRQRASAWANLPLAVLFGVGAAVALLGVARGTVVPLLLDTIAARRLAVAEPAALAGAAVLIATLAVTLLAFQFRQGGAQPGRPTRLIRGTGRALVLAAFGVFLAAAVSTFIAALVGRLQAIADWITQLGTLF